MCGVSPHSRRSTLTDVTLLSSSTLQSSSIQEPSDDMSVNININRDNILGSSVSNTEVTGLRKLDHMDCDGVPFNLEVVI